MDTTPNDVLSRTAGHSDRLGSDPNTRRTPVSTPMTAFRPRKLTTRVEGTAVAPNALRDADSVAALAAIFGTVAGRLGEAIVAVSHDFVSQELRAITADVEKLGLIAGGRGR
jgi:hypothetical protein